MLAVFLLVLLSLNPASAQTIGADEWQRDDFHVRLLGDKEEVPVREGPLKVVGLDDNPRLKQNVEDIAWTARRRIRESTRVDWEGTALVVWVGSEREFLERTGKTPEFTAAAASARRATVWINASSWSRSTPDERLQVMTHELGHLLVGNLQPGTRLPLWAEEGIVMHLANEWNLQRSMTVTRAHAFASLPRLEQLQQSFPGDPEGQMLAYAVGYLAIEEIARDLGDKRGTVTRLMRHLADDAAGPALIASLWNPDTRDAWNATLVESLGSRFTNFVVLLTSGTALWFLIMLLAGMAWMKKRRRRLAAAAAELDEEPWAASLTDRDIQEIYGKREEEAPAEEYPWEKWERLRAEEEER